MPDIGIIDNVFKEWFHVSLIYDILDMTSLYKLISRLKLSLRLKLRDRGIGFTIPKIGFLFFIIV